MPEHLMCQAETRLRRTLNALPATSGMPNDAFDRPGDAGLTLTSMTSLTSGICGPVRRGGADGPGSSRGFEGGVRWIAEAAMALEPRP